MGGFIASNGVWKFDHPRAELRCGLFVGAADVSHPELGLHRLAVNDQSLAGNILGVVPLDLGANASKVSGLDDRASSPWLVAESYVRGRDLIATYDPRDDWPYTTQIYWSAVESDSAEALPGNLSLFVSLQTHLLDTWPTLNIHSQLAADETLLLTDDSGDGASTETLCGGQHRLPPASKATCVLRRLAGARISYVEMMPASDFRELTIRCADDGSCATTWELFADFLEKGVIRRARVQALFLQRQNDIADALALCQAIDRQPLPLTA